MSEGQKEMNMSKRFDEHIPYNRFIQVATFFLWIFCIFILPLLITVYSKGGGLLYLFYTLPAILLGLFYITQKIIHGPYSRWVYFFVSLVHLVAIYFVFSRDNQWLLITEFFPLEIILLPFSFLPILYIILGFNAIGTLKKLYVSDGVFLQEGHRSSINNDKTSLSKQTLLTSTKIFRSNIIMLPVIAGWSIFQAIQAEGFGALMMIFIGPFLLICYFAMTVLISLFVPLYKNQNVTVVENIKISAARRLAAFFPLYIFFLGLVLQFIILAVYLGEDDHSIFNFLLGYWEPRV